MRLNVGLMAFPMTHAGTIPLSHLVAILSALGANVTVVTGDRGYDLFQDHPQVRCLPISHRPARGMLARILSYAWTQIQACLRMIALRNDVQIWIFFTGGDALVLPSLLAKLMGKGLVLPLPASTKNILQGSNDRFADVVGLISRFTCTLADRIVLYTPRLVQDYGLEDFRDKVVFAGEHYLDLEHFRPTIPLHRRRMLVGYVGRLSEEKGVRNLVEAARRLAGEDIELLVIGEGPLDGPLREVAEDLWGNRMRVLGWVPNQWLPERMNELKLLVLPSYTEGLPNVVLEAMACGTPVLCTAVGSIPDIIEDGVNGFILRSNSPENLAAAILACLSRPDLNEVAERGRAMVHARYGFEQAVDGWRAAILNGLKV